MKFSTQEGSIPESIREKIFHPFFTTQSTEERKGLELSLAYDIMRRGKAGGWTWKAKLMVLHSLFNYPIKNTTNMTFLTNKISFFCLLLIAIGCNYSGKQQAKEQPTRHQIKVVEARGYVVPQDSMTTPTFIPVDESKLTKVPVGKPKVVPVPSNIHPAGKPKIVKAGNPRICTPGQDGFSLPKTVPAGTQSFPTSLPKVVRAKEAFAKSQNPQNFSSLTKLQGLTNNSITSLIEDRAGNLWLGTQGGGVTKYDGQTFTHFTKKEGLNGDDITTLFEDRSGNLWFGCFGTGVTKYDGQNFTHFTQKEGIINNNIYFILEDIKKNMWFGTLGGGVTKYDGKSFTHFTEREGMSSNQVWYIFEDSKGNLWFATLDNGVTKYDGNTFAHYTEKEGLSNNIVRSIHEDDTGDMWFSTLGGISKYDGEHFTHFTEKEGLVNNVVWSIFEDDRNNMWFGTERGVSKYDGQHFINFTQKEGFSSKGVWSILADKNKNLWFATWIDGVFQQHGQYFTHYTEKEGLSDYLIESIMVDKKGNLWFGTRSSGVLKYDGQAFTQYTTQEGINNSFIPCILEDKKGNIWFGTNGSGVSKFDGNTFTHFNIQNAIGNNFVYSILEDKSGNLWFGTSGGVMKYDGKAFTYFSEKEGLKNEVIRSILEDKNGNLWFGADVGVSKFDGHRFTHFTEKEGLSNYGVWSILEDKSGNLWFGTNGNGVVKYDGQHFTHFTETEGLSNNQVWSILEDKNRNLWFGTDFGLSELKHDKLDAITQKNQSGTLSENEVIFTNYTYEDGFFGVGVNQGKTICEAQNGDIWIGANDRLTVLHPGALQEQTAAPNMQLTGVALFNENIPWMHLAHKKDTAITLNNGVIIRDFSFEGTSKWYNLPEQLSLAYDNNYLTFSFVGITLQSPGKVKYRYRLEGIEENWNALTTRSEATYGNLSPGDYTFQVKARSGSGVWSHVFEYPFTIRPPWWKTGWAYGVYILMLAFAGWRVHLFQKAATIKKEREKIKDRELEQAKEIEKAYSQLGIAHETLQSTQAQLIQSEKLASLGELTAGIAHEIQNPLNFVNNFAEVSAEMLGEMDAELDKGDTQEARAIAADLKTNLEKINHHGKRASGIVKSMLEHSRTSTGLKEPTDLNALADEYLRLAYHGLRAKDNTFNATMETHFDPDLPKVSVIPQDIGRVLLNLINNAFYAVHQRASVGASLVDAPTLGDNEGRTYEPTVVVSTKRLENTIEIRVQDNGPGIPEAIREKIFQPFFTTKPTGQGTGLGLSLSYDIVKAHGGELKLESTENEGTTFIISLPC